MLDRNAYAKSSAVGVAGRCMARCFAHRSQADIKRPQYARRTRVSLARPIWSMMRSMKKAIGDNMIPKEWGFEKGLELVKQAGFDGIELWLGDVPWFRMGTPDSEVRELRRTVENAGLVVSNVSTGLQDRKSTRLNSSHVAISYAVFCLKKKTKTN